MGHLIVRKLEDEVIATHRRRAQERGVSLEQELRDVLRRAATPPVRSGSGGRARSRR